MKQRIDPVGEAWAEWLQSFEFDTFLTLTFKPQENRVVGPVGAFNAQRRYFKMFPFHIPYFSVAERHRWRDDVHLHTLAKVGDTKLEYLWALWDQGRSRILPLNDRGAAYCAKYLQKETDVPIDFKLWR